MKTLKWMALLPFLLAGAAACDDFGLATDLNKEQGELRWILDRGSLTKAGDSEVPDTNDFLLTITDAKGNVLYAPIYMTIFLHHRKQEGPIIYHPELP